MALDEQDSQFYVNKKPNPFEVKVFVFGMLAMTVYTFFRGFHLPLDYPLFQWLISYDAGLIKRGLIGSLLSPLFTLKTGEEIKDILYICSVASVALKMFCLGYCGARIPKLYEGAFSREIYSLSEHGCFP
jgi:hypothetical protein